jgi:nucleotidyltransferase substrate binding protein (TIGR01987 family)
MLKSMIDYSKFEKSLKHLEAPLRNFQSLAQRPEIDDIDREAIAESVIQRFEICYDCLWKVLKRYLNENLGIPELPNSPKPLFRLAFENQLFPAIEQWLVYANARVDTSHDYSGEKAQTTIDIAFAFAGDAAALYQKMTGKPWA